MGYFNAIIFSSFLYNLTLVAMAENQFFLIKSFISLPIVVLPLSFPFTHFSLAIYFKAQSHKKAIIKEETHKVIFNGLSAHEGNSQAVANEFYAQKKSILIVPSFLLHCDLSVNRILSHLIGHRKLVAFTNNIHSDRFHHS